MDFKKNIKIKFVDFWNEFNYEEFYLYKILKEKYNVIISNNPDYIIYSVFGIENYKYKCIKIFYTGENMRPDFNFCDYAIGFDYMNFEDRYIRFPDYLMMNEHRKSLEKIINNKRNINKKYKFCNMLVSHNITNERLEFFKKLNQYKQVDSGGKILNNIDTKIIDKIEFQNQYKFSIAFENSKSSGYCTEKIVDAFAAGSIPIYYGDINVNKVFNEKAFINIKNSNDFNKAIELIKKIDKDDMLYNQYISEKPINNSKYLNEEQEKLKKFVYNIFDQDLITAKRCVDNFITKHLKNEIKYLIPFYKIKKFFRIIK